MQYRPIKCHAVDIPQICWIYLINWLSYLVNGPIWHIKLHFYRVFRLWPITLEMLSARTTTNVCAKFYNNPSKIILVITSTAGHIQMALTMSSTCIKFLSINHDKLTSSCHCHYQCWTFWVIALTTQHTTGGGRLRHKHHDVIKWNQFPRYWPFVRGIHRPRVDSLHTGQWRGALVFSLICAWKKSWACNWEAGVLRRNRPHYDGGHCNVPGVCATNAILG